MALAPVPGLEARHVWDGSTVLNDLIADYPRARVRTLGGWRSAADAELVSEQNTAREGERPRYSVRRGKTITYEGVLEAKTLSSLRTLQDDLLSAFWDVDEEREMVLQVRSSGAWANRFSYRAKPIDVGGTDSQEVSAARTTFGWERPFMVALRMHDARFFSTTEVSYETGAVSASTLGVVPPFTPPTTLPSSTAGASVTVTNEGSAPADPLIRVYGPATDPMIFNDTLGVALYLSGLELASGSWVDVDFDQRQILLESQSDYRSFLDPASDWWDRGVAGLAPGANVIRLGGVELADPAKAVITFNPARY